MTAIAEDDRVYRARARARATERTLRRTVWEVWDVGCASGVGMWAEIAEIWGCVVLGRGRKNP